jgi:hypothetical protein
MELHAMNPPNGALESAMHLPIDLVENLTRSLHESMNFMEQCALHLQSLSANRPNGISGYPCDSPHIRLPDPLVQELGNTLETLYQGSGFACQLLAECPRILIPQLNNQHESNVIHAMQHDEEIKHKPANSAKHLDPNFQIQHVRPMETSPTRPYSNISSAIDIINDPFSEIKFEPILYFMKQHQGFQSTASTPPDIPLQEIKNSIFNMSCKLPLEKVQTYLNFKVYELYGKSSNQCLREEPSILCQGRNARPLIIF